MRRCLEGGDAGLEVRGQGCRSRIRVSGVNKLSQVCSEASWHTHTQFQVLPGLMMRLFETWLLSLTHPFWLIRLYYLLYILSPFLLSLLLFIFSLYYCRTCIWKFCYRRPSVSSSCFMTIFIFLFLVTRHGRFNITEQRCRGAVHTHGNRVLKMLWNNVHNVETSKLKTPLILCHWGWLQKGQFCKESFSGWNNVIALLMWNDVSHLRVHSFFVFFNAALKG